MERSIYQLINENITDGVLKEGFSLPDEGADDASLKFAPGALDGIHMYHMAHGSLDEAGYEGLAKALESMSEGNFPEADALFSEWTKKYRAVNFIDDIQRYIMDHTDTLDAENCYQTAVSMVRDSGRTECVKIGLEVLELFGEPDEELKGIMRTLGLYDEFTVFAVWNMRKWAGGNQEIFKLAQKTHGWGRIHAVEFLEPESDEIRHWLLTDGTVNDVENAYSALPCWQRSGAEDVLAGQPAQEEYKGISTLIEALLDEGPVRGISELENAESILLRFLAISPQYDLTADDYHVIRTIKDWAENGDELYTSVSFACDDILRSPACREADR